MRLLARLSPKIVRNLFASTTLTVLWTLVGPTAMAQALPTATGPGTYIALGGGLSQFQSDYGKANIRGYAFFMDVNPYWHSGIEVEARRMNYPHFGERQSTLLVGPRWSARSGHFVPYTKLLMGGGQFDFPHGYGTGRYFVVAPGAGLDINISRRAKLRVVDFEYQMWPGFSFGSLKPYGLSAGLSVQVWGFSRSKLSR